MGNYHNNIPVGQPVGQQADPYVQYAPQPAHHQPYPPQNMNYQPQPPIIIQQAPPPPPVMK